MAEQKSYRTVRAYGEDEFTEKRSRFIGYAKPVQTEEEALAFLEEIRAKRWDCLLYTSMVLAMRDGGAQLANLRLLLEYARTYERAGYLSLIHIWTVVANLLIYNNTVIGGDIASNALDGFMQGFRRNSEPIALPSESAPSTPESAASDGESAVLPASSAITASSAADSK